MYPDKSQDPDGFNPSFFQSFWSIVGNDLCRVCLQCLNENVRMLGGNRTNIVLIPKKQNSEFIVDLWPISLCNVANRVVCKMVRNRLKNVLPEVIDDLQSAFIPERMIADNIIMPFELFHIIKWKTLLVYLP